MDLFQAFEYLCKNKGVTFLSDERIANGVLDLCTENRTEREEAELFCKLNKKVAFFSKLVPYTKSGENQLIGEYYKVSSFVSQDAYVSFIKALATLVQTGKAPKTYPTLVDSLGEVSSEKSSKYSGDTDHNKSDYKNMFKKGGREDRAPKKPSYIPKPTPAPVPAPAPKPATTPKPAPKPAPKPTTTPKPAPKPVPKPAPAPAPKPAPPPAPTPAPQSDPPYFGGGYVDEESVYGAIGISAIAAVVCGLLAWLISWICSWFTPYVGWNVWQWLVGIFVGLFTFVVFASVVFVEQDSSLDRRVVSTVILTILVGANCLLRMIVGDDYSVVFVWFNVFNSIASVVALVSTSDSYDSFKCVSGGICIAVSVLSFILLLSNIFTGCADGCAGGCAGCAPTVPDDPYYPSTPSEPVELGLEFWQWFIGIGGGIATVLIVIGLSALAYSTGSDKYALASLFLGFVVYVNMQIQFSAMDLGADYGAGFFILNLACLISSFIIIGYKSTDYDEIHGFWGWLPYVIALVVGLFILSNVSSCLGFDGFFGCTSCL